MKALVSGQAGIAVLIEGGRVSFLHLDSPQPIPRSKADIPHLFADATDVVELPQTTVEKAGAALDLSWRQDRALHLILILLDREADDGARRIAVECLEEFLADSEVSAFVCNRLYSAPLPDLADMVGRAPGATCAAPVARRVRKCQSFGCAARGPGRVAG